MDRPLQRSCATMKMVKKTGTRLKGQVTAQRGGRAVASAVGIALITAGCYGESGTDPAALDLPPPEHGLQLATPAFSVPAGTEVQHCYWFKLASDVDIDVVRFQVKYLAGSHHMNLFQTNQDLADHDADCFGPVDFSSEQNPNGYDLIVGSQSHDFDWTMPDGVAFKLKARRQLMLQTHYVNASTQASPFGVGHVKVNLIRDSNRTAPPC